MALSDYNVSAALNTLISGINIAEGMARADTNNAIRQLMADIATARLGYIAIPLARSTAVSATFAAADNGKHVKLTGTTAAQTITIANQATVAIGADAAIVVRNESTQSWAVALGGGVSLKKNGGTTSTTATLAAGAVAAFNMWASDDWTVTGNGVS